MQELQSVFTIVESKEATAQSFVAELMRETVMVVLLFTVSRLLWQKLKAAKLAVAGGKAPKPRLPNKFAGCAAPRAEERINEQPPATHQAASVRQRYVVAEARKSPSAKPSVKERALEQEMLQQIEQRKFTPALNTFRLAERDGLDWHFSEGLFSAFVQSGIRVGKVDVVERMLRKMKRNGVQPSTEFWQAAFRLLSSRKQFTTIMIAHQLFDQHLPDDRVVLSCLVNAALEVGDPKLASDLLDQKGWSVQHEQNDYVLFFRTYVAAGSMESAEALFRRLDGDQASPLMLNLVLLVCVNANRPERAKGLLDLAHAQKLADIVSYNTVLKGFLQCNMRKHGLELLRELLRKPLTPDETTCSTLINMFTDIKQGSAKEIIEILLDHRESWDTVMCTVVIKGLIRADRVSMALELYEGMKQQKRALPDIVIYSVMIKALVDHGNLRQALILAEDLKTASLKPDDIITTHILEGCRKVGDVELGERFYQEFAASGSTPSQYLLTAFLKLFGRRGDDRAHNVLLNWEAAHGWRPSVLHYTCAISGSIRSGNSEQAWKTYQLMRTRRVMPDEIVFQTMLQGVTAARRWDRVLTLVDEATTFSKEVHLPQESLNSALTQMLVDSPDQALKLRRSVEKLAAL